MIALLKRDLRLAVRSGGGFGLALVFFLIVVVLVPFGIGPDTVVLAEIGPGILWIGALLASLLSLDRMFALDHEDGTLAVLATSPLPLEGVVAIKAIAHWITTGLPLALFSQGLAILLNLDGQVALWLLVSLLVGTPALSLIGSFGAALTVGIKRGGLLLSLLVLPLYIPTLIFGSLVASRVSDLQDPSTALILLAAVSLGTAAMLPFAGAAAIRANLR